ncbi:MAG: hypothetical protein KatS3mg129_2647 [Leptospiraceae bacterium]|nr:MAG: hypothetical protein KatS3mg129_2647 [Leptospiraceae bacterium]
MKKLILLLLIPLTLYYGEHFLDLIYFKNNQTLRSFKGNLEKND